mmetsp:Transcript_2502/g.6545  ORF Transcript_2502/g.6545 Transcript_2502/m.6545 type:complete len:234 (-) Transcript_2502:265-966(-)
MRHDASTHLSSRSVFQPAEIDRNAPLSRGNEKRWSRPSEQRVAATCRLGAVARRTSTSAVFTDDSDEEEGSDSRRSSSCNMSLRMRSASPPSEMNRSAYSSTRWGRRASAAAAIAPELDPATASIGGRAESAVAPDPRRVPPPPIVRFDPDGDAASRLRRRRADAQPKWYGRRCPAPLKERATKRRAAPGEAFAACNTMIYTGPEDCKNELMNKKSRATDNGSELRDAETHSV